MKFENDNTTKEIIYFIDVRGFEYTLIEETEFIYNYIDNFVNSNSTLIVYDQNFKPIPLKANNIKSIFYYYENHICLRLLR